MDLYFIKFKATSKATAEVIIGYFFGKVNNVPEFDFVVVPIRFSELIDEINIDDNLFELKEQLEKVKTELKKNSGVYDVTLAFLSYINNMLNRRGKIAIGIEFSTAVKNEELDVLSILISNLLEEWSPKMDVIVKAEKMLLEEYSAMSFLEVKEDFSDEEVAKVYSRADIVDLPEVFPVIDPINGTSITRFDVGDRIYTVLLNPGKYESKLKEFLESKETSKGSFEAIEGVILSKEIVRTKTGTLYLIKVEIAEGIIAKALVSPVLKILYDSGEFALKKQKQTKETVKEDQVRKYGTIKVEVPPATGSELIISFLTTLLIVAGIIIVMYIFMR